MVEEATCRELSTGEGRAAKRARGKLERAFSPPEECRPDLVNLELLPLDPTTSDPATPIHLNHLKPTPAATLMAFLYRPIASTSSLLFSRPLVRFSSTTSAFSPHGSTSAHTQIPYGSPSLASFSYLPSPTSSSASPDPATRTSPKDLTPKQRQVLERIVRVDQAGELGANYIYMGQLAVLSRGKDKRVADLVQVRLPSPRSPIPPSLS